MHRTREQVRQAYADLNPDVAELLREDADAVINIGVSFDGTWHMAEKRFHFPLWDWHMHRHSHRFGN